MFALWNSRERADATQNRRALDGIDTGTEQLEDHFALDSLICHCSTWYWTKVRSIRDLDIYLPRQTHYPLFFMAQVLAAPSGVSVATGQTTSDLIVTRSDASQPWRITMQVFDAGYGPTGRAAGPPQLGADGYDIPVPTQQAKSARKWPAMVAAYYNRLKQPGPIPTSSPLQPGPLTSNAGLSRNRQGADLGNGLIAHYKFVVSGFGAPWVMEIDSVTACADVLEYVTQTWARPRTVFQQIDGIKPNWGPDLDTGYYSKIVTTWEWPICVTSYPDGLDVWGPSSGGYPIHDGGVPATPGPDTTRIL